MMQNKKPIAVALIYMWLSIGVLILSEYGARRAIEYSGHAAPWTRQSLEHLHSSTLCAERLPDGNITSSGQGCLDPGPTTQYLPCESEIIHRALTESWANTITCTWPSGLQVWERIK